MVKPRLPDEFKELIYDAFCNTECPYSMSIMKECQYKVCGACIKFNIFALKIDNAFNSFNEKCQELENIPTRSESNDTKSQPNEVVSEEQTT